MSSAFSVGYNESAYVLLNYIAFLYCFSYQIIPGGVHKKPGCKNVYLSKFLSGTRQGNVCLSKFWCIETAAAAPVQSVSECERLQGNIWSHS